MNFQFPAKASNSTPNLIREVLDRGAKIPGFVSLAIGNPAAEAIPTEEILQAMQEVLDEDPMLLFQYGPQAGYEPLRQYTLDYLENKKRINLEGQSLLMLSGSAQGLGLAPRTLCAEGDVVFTDEFSFTNGINAIKNSGCVVKGIKMDADGMIPSALEEAAEQGGGKYIYLIPNFHNPLGTTMPIERRKAIYDVARAYDLLIYEDDPYGDIRFTGETVPAFKSFDVDGRVILAGSYSKVLSAGLRVGYLLASEAIIKTMSQIKSTTDGQAPILNQMIVYKAMQKLDYATYIKSVSEKYGRKCNVMMNAMHKYCSDKIKFAEPEGGMFVWMEMPDGIDVEAFYEACLAKGVGMVKSKAFAADPEGNPGRAFRLNYTFATDEKIEEAVHIMGDLTHEFCD